MLLALAFERKGRGATLLNRGDAYPLLQTRGSVVQVDVVFDLHLSTAQTHEGDTWLDGRRVFGEDWGIRNHGLL